VSQGAKVVHDCDRRDSVSRRVFVRAGALSLVSFGLDPLFLARTAFAAPALRRATGNKVLVCLFQRGAVDGLNMIVPHAERAYYRDRPRIAIPRPGSGADAALDLDGRFGLHPRLAPLKPLWDRGQLALVHAVGSPDSTRSHFDAQDYMDSGTPGIKSTRDGWANRALAHAADHRDTPFRGVAFGQALPRALHGRAPALAIPDLQAFGIRAPQAPVRDRLTAAFEELYGGAATGIVAATAAESFEAVQLLRRADPTQYTPAHGASYPRGQLGRALLQVAQLIKADLGTEIAFVDVGGWDTHVNQGAGSSGQLAVRLSELGGALAAFATDLGERMADVVVLTMSEFGRTVAENGNVGTDHGHATAMMVLGGAVRGGRVLGRWPGLEREQRYEGRDVAVTTDFRDLFGEVVQRHLGVTRLDAVFPGFAADPARFPGVLA
jgi:uncharacterized protein (DUF1501 family)